MVKRQKRILLALGWYDYRLHRGIEKFALEHGWRLYANLAREKVLPWGWQGDGILAWLGAGEDLAEFVLRVNKPTVDFSFRRPQLHLPRVLEDHAHAAELVAEHFTSRGFSNFVYYSESDNWSYVERGEGFVRALERAGHKCLWLRWHQSPEYRTDQELWERRRRWLGHQLKHLPKPLAVFAANDEQAVHVLETCEHTGLAVPEQVAIVGAENYLLAQEAMHIPISSVDTNLELLGYRGAELLESLMSGKPAPKAPVRVPAAGLLIRKSSDFLAIPHAGLARCLRFMWDHYHEPINVQDLVRLAGMSRRGLYTAFLEHTGRSPGDALNRMRIERAKKLLFEAEHKMEVLAEMCGYRSVTGFWVAFKRATGMSPKKYQAKLRGNH